MTRQPIWKFVANLGDFDFMENGAYLIFEDETGVYDPEAELFDPIYGRIYRFALERLEYYNGMLIPYGFSERKDLPYSLDKYEEWFSDDLDSISNATGISIKRLIELLTSEVTMDRAVGYACVGEYHGYKNFDTQPLDLIEGGTKNLFQEFNNRYGKYLKHEA